jgi:hypothetical protein
VCLWANIDRKAARNIWDHTLVPVAHANSACLSANGWIDKYVPITYHSIPAIIVQGSLAESRGTWGEENAIYVSDARHIPGIYTAADIRDIEKCVSHELFGDGNAHTFGSEVKVEQVISAGGKTRPRAFAIEKLGGSCRSFFKGSAYSTQTTTASG